MDSTKTYSGRKNLADIHTPLIFNQWYVAGLDEEFSRELQERYILDRSIVLYRKEDGSPVALQNRCAHRSYPLHVSRLEGDNIRCGYHGIKYNSVGEIIDVPCQLMCPKVRIKHYALREIGPFVWIWMGDAETADEDMLPELPVHADPDWRVIVGGYNRVEANYLLMHENLCDLSHLPYLHAKTFATEKGYAEIPLTVEKVGAGVTFYRHTESRWDLIKFIYPPSVDLSDTNFEHRSGGTFLSPAMHSGYGKLSPKDGSPKLTHHVNHFLTPEHQDSCHYFWYVARNYALHDTESDNRFRNFITAGFEEDKVASRLMQEMLTKDHHNFRELNVAADKAGAMMRMNIKKLADAENKEER
jgi:phenylpropionate dioxygenase-like ring-hydroxylating dioxygenase large terminal subunit